MNEDLSPVRDTAPKKRTRVQLSCTACRYRKLKCCRNYPCSNCKKRGEEGSCTYVGRGPRGKAQHGRSSPTAVQGRLQHLENLVMSLAQKQGSDSKIDLNAQPGSNDADATPSLGSCDPNTELAPVDTGKLVVKNEGTNYIDSANWLAILEDIKGMKEYLDESQEDFEDDGVEVDTIDKLSPVLLLGNSRSVGKEEVLVDIPPRSITDRLVSRFLKTSEPARIVLHMPTFQKEYEEFWLHPAEKSFTWISLLYSIMALAVSIYYRSAEPLPSNMANPISLWATFRKRSSECLIQANYITPGRYKGEALFLHSLTEFYRSQDAQVGVSYLLGITIRLTMRMGYHRDPSHYPMLSPFEGEMRRRLWELLTQFDTLISFQVGVPRTIQPWQFDTELPSNLLDTDFDESSTQLPSPRPKHERTDCSYTRAKAQFMRVFGQITDLAFSREHSSYDEILEIDRRLETAHNSVPSFLQMRPMTQSIADPAGLIMRRFTLEILYLKSRLVLHRRYIGETNEKFAYSQSVCLAAARQSLQYHIEMHNESSPGGQIYEERHFLNSIQNTDFLLSVMILCLQLSQDEARGDAARFAPQECVDFLFLLETTHRIFMESQHQSVDTQRAASALGIMLKRVKGPHSECSHSINGSMTDQFPSESSTHAALDDLQASMDLANDSGTQAAIPGTSQTPSYTPFGIIEDMFNGPTELDWRLYDSRISGVEMATNNNVWYYDAPATPYEFITYDSLEPPMGHENHHPSNS